MFRLADDLRVYLHRDPIDFRAGINSLAILVEQAMGLNPFERAVFAFCNRRRTRIKMPSKCTGSSTALISTRWPAIRCGNTNVSGEVAG